MLDIKFIKDNVEYIKENINRRNVAADVDKLINLYNIKVELQKKIDNLRKQRNENSSKMKLDLPMDEKQRLVDEGKELKNLISNLENEERNIESEFLSELYKIPNLTHSTTPIGKSDKDSKELRKVGIIPNFKFMPKDHVNLGQLLDIIDFDKASIVSGQKFYYLKNQGALLELALIQYGIKKLVSKGFTPYLTPDLAKSTILEGIGFNPRGNESNIYSLENSDLCLVGTAEITLGGLYYNNVFKESELPIKMVGFSHCFRTEAGASGQLTKGLYRVHQFSKVEMFVICKPDDSDNMLEILRSIEEEIYQELEIPYRLLDVASGELGNPAYKKYDLESWMPGRKDYGEITSASNCTDYQSRRLNIRYKNLDNKNIFVHMLNGTVVAVPRVIISILENFQNEDGSVSIPKVLVPYVGFDKISKEK